MITDDNFEHLAGNLSEAAVRDFLISHGDKLVHFCMRCETDSHVAEIRSFDIDELSIASTSTDIGELMVIYTHKHIAEAQLGPGASIGSVKLAEAVSIAQALKSIAGIVFQGQHSAVTVYWRELE